MFISLASYMVFIGFARMIHPNYYWSIYAVGCVAFFSYLASNSQTEAAA